MGSALAEGRFWQKTVSAGGAFGRGPLRQRRTLFAEDRIRESAVSTEDRFAGGPPLQSDILTARKRHTSQEKPGSIQEDQEAVRDQPGSSQGGPGAARSHQWPTRSSQGQLGAARGSQEQPGAARNSQGQPEAPRSSQEEPNHMCFHSSKFKPYCESTKSYVFSYF